MVCPGVDTGISAIVLLYLTLSVFPTAGDGEGDHYIMPVFHLLKLLYFIWGPLLLTWFNFNSSIDK